MARSPSTATSTTRAGRASRRSRPGSRPTPATTSPPAGEERRLARLRRQLLLRRLRVRRPRPAKIRAPLGDRDNVSAATPTTAASSSTRATTARRAWSSSPTRAASSTTRVTDDATARGHLPRLLLGRRRRDHRDGLDARDPDPVLVAALPAGGPRRPGASCSTATARATSATRCSARACRATATASSAARTPSPASTDLPPGGHLVVAPYVTRSADGDPARRARHAARERAASTADGGVDVKWTPNADTAVDATINPDFSQIESDVAQIAANERFALFYPEKRPFFLEGIELFSTPIQAVYTRTITVAALGLRAHRQVRGTRLHRLVAEDRGRRQRDPARARTGSELRRPGLPLVRGRRRGVRRDFGRSVRELPRHRPRDRRRRLQPRLRPRLPVAAAASDTVTGQFLSAGPQTPNRPDLAAEWDGRRSAGHAARPLVAHQHAEVRLVRASTRTSADDFRADNGFVPQVGYRETYGEAGRTFRPAGVPAPRAHLRHRRRRARTARAT